MPGLPTPRLTPFPAYVRLDDLLKACLMPGGILCLEPKMPDTH